MKKYFVIFYIFVVIPLLMNCQGNIEIISDTSKTSLHGSWINKEYAPGWNDTIVTIYSFMSNNKFEVSEFEVYQTNHADTLYYGGKYSFQMINLMYVSYDYCRRQDTIYSIADSRDTIIYQINDNYLFLCTHGRSYNQIYGQTHTLANGKFYDAIKLGNKYSHDIYYFTSDTLYRYSTRTETSYFPQVWDIFNKYAYSNTDRYIDIEIDGDILRFGYIFYRGKLIIAWSPRKYKKL